MPNRTQIAGVSIPVTLDGSKLNTQAGQIGNSLEKQFSGVAGRITRLLAGAFAVKSLAKFGQQCLELGSDLAEVQNVVDVTFTSMNGKINEFAQNAASQFGLSETMAKRYAGTFGAMSKAFGFAEDQAAEMSMTLTGLAGDIASFYNIDQSEAYTKLKSVFTGETESLKDLGVVMTQTALDQYAMANGFGKTTAKMSEQEKVALRYQFVLDQLAGASGDFARTSGSWANQVRLLKLQFESLSATIGQVLIAALTPAIRALNSFMGALVKAANTFKSFIFSLFGLESQDMAAGGAAAMEGALGGLSDSAGGAASDLGDVGNAAGGAADDAAAAAKKIQRSLMGFDKINKLSEIADDASSGGSGGSGSGKGTGGAGSLGDTSSALKNTAYDVAGENGPLSKIMQKLQALKDIMANGFWEGLGDQSVFKSIRKNIESIGESLKEIFSDEKVTAAANGYLESLAGCIGRMAGSIVSIGATIADNLTGGISKYLEQNKTRIQNWLVDMFTLGSAFYDKIGELSVAVAEIFSVFRGDDAKQITADLISIFASTFGGIIRLAASFGNDILSLIVDPITNNAGSIRLAIENTLGPLRTVMDGITLAWTQAWNNIQHLYDYHVHPLLQSVTSTVTEVVGNLADGYNEYIAPVLDKLSEKFKAVIERHVVPALGSIGELLGTVIDNIKECWDSASVAIIWISKHVMPVLKPIVDFLGSRLIKKLEETADGIKFVADTLNGILEAKTLEGKWDAISKALSTMADGIRRKAIEIANSIIGVVNDMIATVVGALKGTAIGNFLDFLAKGMGVKGGLEGIKIPLIAEFKPSADKIYKQTRSELSKSSKNSPVELRGNLHANELIDNIPADKKDIKTTAWMKSVRDGLTSGQKTVQTKAEYTSVKDSLTGLMKTVKTTADFISRTDSLTAGQKTFNSTAKFTTFADYLRNVWMNAQAHFTSYTSAIYPEIEGSVHFAGYTVGQNVIRGLEAGLRMASGGVYAHGRWQPIQQFASGGNPTHGQLFMAREAGPELVGTLGGHTAVMNNDQIVASVASGVARAISGIKFYNQDRATPHLAQVGTQVSNSTAELVQLAREANENTRNGSSGELIQILRDILFVLKNLDLDVKLDGKSVKDRIVQLINANTRATGVCEINI